MKMTEGSWNQLKTVLEKEKLLVMSNFSFSNSVFKRILLQTHENQGLFGKRLSHILFVSILLPGNYTDISTNFVGQWNFWSSKQLLLTGIELRTLWLQSSTS